LNAADEMAVKAFLDARIAFPAIPAVVAATMERVPPRPLRSISEVLDLDGEARGVAREMIERRSIR
jgi:1-deoxy-D-xylulose-5-phosphate reductoisomerase